MKADSSKPEGRWKSEDCGRLQDECYNNLNLKLPNSAGVFIFVKLKNSVIGKSKGIVLMTYKGALKEIENAADYPRCIVF